MKRLLLIVLTIGFGITVFGQYKPVTKNQNVVRTQVEKAIDMTVPGSQAPNVYVGSRSILDDPQVIMTNYDLMSNGSTGERLLYLWPDGALSSVSTFSDDLGGTWADRGTAYNYSADGTTWGTLPNTRLESVRTGWPSLQPVGANGECIVSHQSGTTPLVFSKRATRGTGAWTQSLLPLPAGATGMLWPRMITNGTDHNTIHIICLTSPTGNGGTAYNGMDGALLYIKSTDGGSTWGTWEQLAGMGSSEYFHFSGDDYGWANPVGNTIAFVNSSAFMDTFIMKSTDNGTTWTKTVIYESPYNLVGVEGNSPLRFLTSDNSSAIVLDKNGIAHVTFGLMADSISGSTSYNYWPYTQGVAYWNESMPGLGSELNLDTLYDNGQLPAFVTDTMIYYAGDLASYRSSGLTSMPTMAIDADNNLILAWSCPTVNLDASNFMMRHLYTRVAEIAGDGSATWNDNIYDLNTFFLYNFTECVWPSLAMNSTDNEFFIQFMADDLAGSYVNGVGVAGYAGQTSISDNYQTVMTIDKPSVGVGVNDKKEATSSSFTVSANYPNPFQGSTSIGVATSKAGNLKVEVTNLTGQKVISLDKGFVNAGSYRYAIDGSQLTAGIYFYTVTVNHESKTMKMIVK